MARRKIVWTKSANQDRIEILSYWIERNSSKSYSLRLNKMIKEATKKPDCSGFFIVNFVD